MSDITKGFKLGQLNMISAGYATGKSHIMSSMGKILLNRTPRHCYE